MRLWSRIADHLASEDRLALVTVVETRGSTPRDSGARMIVLSSGAFSGTIGGGTLEWQAMGAAQSLLARGERSLALRDLALGPELGQCCGGRLKIAIEILNRDDLPLARALSEQEKSATIVTVTRSLAKGCERRVATTAEAAALGAGPVAWQGGVLLQRFEDERTSLHLFGAGHVGRALVLALAPLPFRITWLDPRPNAFPVHIAGEVAALAPQDPAAALAAAPDGSFILVMTHSHALDLDIVARALAAERFPYVGLIGSATKRARFLGRLGELGLGAAAEQRLVCPIGLTSIRSKLPAAIAIGIAADLLVRREQLLAAAASPQSRHAHG